MINWITACIQLYTMCTKTSILYCYTTANRILYVYVYIHTYIYVCIELIMEKLLVIKNKIILG